MKKLLVLLLISILAIFAFAGCDGFTPAEGEGEGEGEGEVEICPTVDISTEFVDADGKAFIKAGKRTVTVTFDVPTEPVAVYVAEDISKDLADGVPDSAKEVVVYSNSDNTVYSGSFVFDGDCESGYIYVTTCETCAPCKYPYVVDSDQPFIGPVKVCIEECVCEGYSLTFTGIKTDDCDTCDPKVYCGDCCSGFAGYSIALYDSMPFDECCETPCAEPIDSGSGDCQVDWTSDCLTAPGWEDTRTVWALVTALDNVGNVTKWLAEITIDFDAKTFNLMEACPDVGEKWDDCVDTPVYEVCDSGTLNP